MTPVVQTSYGKSKGNCLAACVASILDVPISALPDFEGVNRSADGAWFERVVEFCQANGFSLVYWHHSENMPIICLGTYVIVLLELEGCEELHAVIGETVPEKKTRQEDGDTIGAWGTELIHDPNEHGYPPVKGPAGYLVISKQ